MRRIKDIEAIESDSFVPQAFKSSRDDMKVRRVSLSPPSSHSCYLFSLSLIEFTSLRCRLSRDSPDRISHSLSSVCSDLRRFHQMLHCSALPKQQHPHKSHTRQQSSSVFLSLSLSPPFWWLQMQTKHRSHY